MYKQHKIFNGNAINFQKDRLYYIWDKKRNREVTMKIRNSYKEKMCKGEYRNVGL